MIINRNRYICDMNKTVQLVNEWAAYEEMHPGASLDEFCRYYLTIQRAKQDIGENFGGRGVPPSSGSYLMKLIGYISRVFEVYIEKAMADIPEVHQKDDFFFLNNITHAGECRKTDVAQSRLMGLSTGIDTLNRLLANGLIEERIDPTDKRARLVKTTEKGQAVLMECYRRSTLVNEIIFKDLSPDDLKLCIQLLRGVELKHSSLVLETKDKTIEEIYEIVMGKKPDLPKV